EAGLCSCSTLSRFEAVKASMGDSKEGKNNGNSSGWMAVPAFGEWDMKNGVPDYSMDFTKIREMRKQNKHPSRASLGNDDELQLPSNNNNNNEGEAEEEPRRRRHRHGSPTVRFRFSSSLLPVLMGKRAVDGIEALWPQCNEGPTGGPENGRPWADARPGSGQIDGDRGWGEEEEVDGLLAVLYRCMRTVTLTADDSVFLLFANKNVCFENLKSSMPLCIIYLDLAKLGRTLECSSD
ncbi:unnamed protein product, partial [Musa acuminata var. zebrina]